MNRMVQKIIVAILGVTRPMQDAKAPSPSLRRRRWWLLRWAAVACCVLLLAYFQFIRSIAGETYVELRVERFGEPPSPPFRPPQICRLVNINIAHGRATHSHQLFRSEEEIGEALEAIANFIDEQKADFACYQEIDAPSWWSGQVDQFAHIARKAGHAYGARTLSVTGAGLHYGTAISSRWPLHGAEAHTFSPTPPSPSKGFTLARCSWPGDPAFHFHLVSLHLDFTSASNRSEQIDHVIDQLDDDPLPVIVAGDFNDEGEPDGALRRLVDAIDGRSIDRELELVTFPTLDSWIDWVVVTDPFAIRATAAPELGLSDHRPLVVDIVREAVPGRR